MVLIEVSESTLLLLFSVPIEVTGPNLLRYLGHMAIGLVVGILQELGRHLL